jgi:hypothetical protein
MTVPFDTFYGSKAIFWDQGPSSGYQSNNKIVFRYFIWALLFNKQFLSIVLGYLAGQGSAVLPDADRRCGLIVGQGIEFAPRDGRPKVRKAELPGANSPPDDGPA